LSHCPFGHHLSVVKNRQPELKAIRSGVACTRALAVYVSYMTVRELATESRAHSVSPRLQLAKDIPTNILAINRDERDDCIRITFLRVEAPGLPVTLAVGHVVNRVDNTVSMFTINATNGTLILVPTVATGSEPFRIAIDPSGHFAYAANENGASVSVYTLSNGTLTPAGMAATLGTALSVVLSGTIEQTDD